MKTIFLILCLLFVLSVTAQNSKLLFESSNIGDSLSYSEQMTDIISELDKGEITTGILVDKSIMFSSMDSLNGLNEQVVTLKKWKQIYRQLFISQIYNMGLPNPDSLPSDSFSDKDAIDVIPFAILNIDYNQFKENSFENNLLRFSNGKIQKVIGAESPYLQKKLFAAVALKDQINSNKVMFRITSQLFIQNNALQPSYIEIDFDDGNGFVRIFSKGDIEREININYSSVGEKIIKTKVYFDDGSTLQSYSTFYVLSINTHSYNSSFAVSGAWGGGTSTGTAYVLYGCGNNNQLRKPIVVSDGFDPANERHYNEIYDLMNRENLIEKLLAESFDVVILDYNSGADYIQRNAQVLISTINNINTQLAVNGSNEQLIIVGPSMAGLISRYALSYMEQNNINHNTRLYISFDSPHLGANIPLGDQYWLDFFADVAESQGAIDGRNQLNSIAAKQMLVYHSSTFPYQTSLRTNLINDPYFSFPTMCRKVAFSNGSKNNSNIYFSPVTQIISYRYRNWKVDIDGNAWAVPTYPSSATTIFFGVLDIIGPYYVENEVKVGNTYPYDGAAGGSSDVNKIIADGDTDGHGDIETSYPNHDFIPMVSSLALSSSIYKVNTPFDVSNLPNYPFINNSSITPFDAVYAPVSNQEHVKVTNETVNWMMQEIGASELYLQNKTVNLPTDYQARNTILAGNHITNSIPHGDFIVQNNTGVVNITAGEEIILESGTTLKPTGNGSIHLFINPYPCELVNYSSTASYSRNFNKEELQSLLPSFNQIECENVNSDVFMKAFPNPFVDYVHIEYLLKENADIDISLYNMKGVKVNTVINSNNVNTGKYLVSIDTKDILTGTYVCVLTQNSKVKGVMKIQKQE